MQMAEQPESYEAEHHQRAGQGDASKAVQVAEHDAQDLVVPGQADRHGLWADLNAVFAVNFWLLVAFVYFIDWLSQGMILGLGAELIGYPGA
jgi:hypothetical protein